MGRHDDVFKIDEECGSETGGASPDSEAGPGKPGLDHMPSPTSGANEDIELSRRAVPVVHQEDDVCSICLDDFTAEDPEQQTCCECVHLTNVLIHAMYCDKLRFGGFQGWWHARRRVLIHHLMICA